MGKDDRQKDLFHHARLKNEQGARNKSQKDMKIYKSPRFYMIKSNLDLLLLLKSQFHQISIDFAEILLIAILRLLALLS